MKGPNLFGEEEPEKGSKRKARGGRRVDFPVPMPSTPTTCEACGAGIIYARIRGGSTMPLDVASLERRAGKPYMESHFAHCPAAARFRKPKGSPCAARSCSRKVPEDAPFCGECWARLSIGIRNQIRERFQEDADRGKGPSQAFDQALELARVFLDR